MKSHFIKVVDILDNVYYINVRHIVFLTGNILLTLVDGTRIQLSPESEKLLKDVMRSWGMVV